MAIVNYYTVVFLVWQGPLGGLPHPSYPSPFPSLRRKEEEVKRLRPRNEHLCFIPLPWPSRTCVTKILPNFRVNFLMWFTSIPLFLLGNDRQPPRIVEKNIWCGSCEFLALCRSWFSGREWGQQLFSFHSSAVHWMARTSSLNCLSCRKPYQTLVHWIASSLFTEKPFFSLTGASSYPLPKIGSDYGSFCAPDFFAAREGLWNYQRRFGSFVEAFFAALNETLLVGNFVLALQMCHPD